MNKTGKILLVSTGYSPANEMDSGKGQLQLGQLYLATILNKKGYKTTLYSNLFPEPEEFIKLIEEENFDITGFYSTTNTVERVKGLVNMVKTHFPEKPVFLGGPHPTVLDREILEETKADLVIRHEGEYVFLKVLDYYYKNKGRLEDIKGITFKKGTDIIRNPSGDFIKKLDELPLPDWSLLNEDLKKINSIYPSVMTGRGCPFKCSFCFEAFGGNAYRLRSAGHVMKEIDMLLENRNVKYIKFVDDTFVVNPDRVIKICNELIKRRKKHNFYWFCEGRADIINKRLKLLKKMKEAGLILIQIGVESGNQHILDLYNKDIRLEEIENVVKTCVENEIFCISINVIIGGPLESDETLENTEKFIKKLIRLAPGRIFCQTSLLTPYPSTPIKEHPEKFGLINIDPHLLGGQTEETCFMETKNLNSREIYRRRTKFHEEIYRTMIEEIKNMTPSQIEEHINLTDYGIKTPWYDIIMEQEGMRKYFHLKRHSLYKSTGEIAEEILEECCPVRTIPLEYRNKKVIFNEFNRKEELSERESIFYEYSSGKLSLKEIVKILSKKLMEKQDKLKKEMITFYKRMEKDYRIIFSRI